MRTGRQQTRFLFHLTFVLACFVFSLFLGSPAAKAIEEYNCGSYSAGNYNEACPDTRANNDVPLTQELSPPDGTGSPVDDDPAPQTIILSDSEGYNGSEGVIFDVAIGDVIEFTVDGERHTVTIKAVYDDYSIVTIASTPQDVRVNLGQTVEYDVNDDGANDIAIRYMSRTALGAGFNVRQLSVTSVPSTPDNQWWLLGIISIIAIITITILVVKLRRGKI